MNEPLDPPEHEWDDDEDDGDAQYEEMKDMGLDIISILRKEAADV